MNLEKPTSKDFEFEVMTTDRERGHVSIMHGNQIYKWFLRPDGQTLVLLTGDERTLEATTLRAMKEQAWAILKPALKSHNLKNLRAGSRAHDE